MSINYHNIEISTPKIENITSNCLRTGALGAKINGSGFSGTIIALLPEKEDVPKKSIKDADGEASLIKSSKGIELY